MNKQEKQVEKRGKKIVAGKEIQPSDLNNSDKAQPGISKVKPSNLHENDNAQPAKSKAKRRKIQEVESSSESENDGSLTYQETSDDSSESENDSPKSRKITKSQFETNQWIVVKYEGKRANCYLNYIGKILEVKPRIELKVQFAKKQPGSNYFKFTENEDDVDHAVPYDA